ncbi:MAG: hypothetical protein NTZ83_02405 [Candidatus Pacearchaeota archaeon]|nr:hypothetical protein [Candidatus Pacearchaeota archaeon]
MDNRLDKLGAWAFIIGLVIAIIIAIFGTNQTWPMYLLLFLGLVVGLLNITNREVGSFLLAGIAFLFTFTALSTLAGGIPLIGDTLAKFLNLVNAFIAPAVAVVAVKALFVRTKH